MSKAARARRHDEKMKQRRAKKAAKKTLYASLAGTSHKRKRQVVKSRVAGGYKHAHVMSDCGNVGCERCYPKPTLMPRPKRRKKAKAAV